MISGEYAVLDGAPAIVAAVGARAIARLSPPASDGSGPLGGGSHDETSSQPEVVVARRCAESALGPMSMQLTVDTHALREGDRKLGLGSSAAAAVGAVAAVMAFHGRDLADAAVRREMLSLADRGHRAIAPQGSGADVAASALGGWVRFERHGEDVDARPLAWPDALTMRVAWTGKPARTSELVAKVKALAARDAAAHGRAIGAVREAAAALLAAIERGDAGAAALAMDVHGRAMQALGEAADAPIVTAELAQIAALARECGGGAKPSGAGGGDVAIACFASPGAAEAFDERCRAAGVTLLDLVLGEEGPRREPDPDDARIA